MKKILFIIVLIGIMAGCVNVKHGEIVRKHTKDAWTYKTGPYKYVDVLRDNGTVEAVKLPVTKSMPETYFIIIKNDKNKTTRYEVTSTEYKDLKVGDYFYTGN